MTKKIEMPTFDQLMWPTLQALKVMGGSASNEELLQKVIEIRRYPSDVQNFMDADHRRTKLEYNLAWAKTYLKAVGAADNSQCGVWSITDVGETLTPADIHEIPSRVRKKVYIRKRDNSTPSAEPTNEVEKDWEELLLDVLTKMSLDAFECLSQRVLRESRLIKVQVTGRSGDGEIDGLGVLRLALLSFQVSFQCKGYKGSVGPSAIRDFRGAMLGRSDKGLFITTGVFTADTQKKAVRDVAPAIDLIDGNLLCGLLKDLKLDVTTTMVEKVEIEPDWFGRI